MPEVQWGLAAQNNPLNYFAFGQQMGTQARERQDRQERQNALAAYATNPDDPNALAGVIKVDPATGMQLRGDQQQRAAQAAAAQRVRVTDISKLFDGVTPENYTSRIQAAQAMGIDVTGVPQQYDPNWIAQNKAIFSAFGDGADEQISGIARELVDAGYKPGTPEFNNAMRGVIQNKYATDYVDDAGNTRRRSALQLDGAPTAAPTSIPRTVAPAGSGEALTADQWQGAVSSLGKVQATEWARRSGRRIPVSTPAEARSYPSGTPLILPDGRPGVSP